MQIRLARSPFTKQERRVLDHVRILEEEGHRITYAELRLNMAGQRGIFNTISKLVDDGLLEVYEISGVEYVRLAP